MKTLIAFILLILIATSAYAVAPDIRIVDNDGDVLSLNSDGSVNIQ